MISVVVISVSDVSVAMSGDRAGLVWWWKESPTKNGRNAHRNTNSDAPVRLRAIILFCIVSMNQHGDKEASISSKCINNNYFSRSVNFFIGWFAGVEGLPVRVVPTAADGLTAMSSHLRQAHKSLSMRLTPARDFTVCSRYLDGIPKGSISHFDVKL